MRRDITVPRLDGDRCRHRIPRSPYLACVHVAAVSFPFPGGDQTSERKSGRGKEHARSALKLGRSREGVSEKGEGVGRRVSFSRLTPPPSAPYFSYSIPLSFPSREFFSYSLQVSLPSRKFLETPVTQATRNWICKFFKRTLDRDIPYEAKVCLPDNYFIYI